MNRKRIRLRIITLIYCAVFLITAGLSVSASENAAGIITITALATDGKPIPGVKITLYHVASWNTANDNFVISDPFLSAGIDGSAFLNADTYADTAARLEAYAKENRVTGFTENISDKDGNMKFNSLDKGVYLLCQTNASDDFVNAGYKSVTTKPLLIILPWTDDSGNPRMEATLLPKMMTELPSPQTTELTVHKIWKDNSNAEGTRPSSIKIGLYRDNTLYKAATLSDVNNWTYTWTNLDTSHTWKAKEAGVPSDYSMSASQAGTVITITNTRTTTTKPPEKYNGKLIQTGQPQWLIPLFAGIGIPLIFMGIFLVGKNKKKKDCDKYE